jgi:hypothetical protein
LPAQSIFYPVLNAAYAAQIARDWNTKRPGAAGYVTRFEVNDALAALDQLLAYSTLAFDCEVVANQVAVFLHFPFWRQRDFGREGVSVDRRDRVVSAITGRWRQSLADRPLPGYLRGR